MNYAKSTKECEIVAYVYQRDNKLQNIIGNIGKGSTFREKLTQQAVGIFICATLPWRIRIAKIYLHSRFFGQLLMCGKFFTVIRGKAFLRLIGKSRESFNSRFSKRIILSVVNSESDKKSRFAFDVSTETTRLTFPEHSIAAYARRRSVQFAGNCPQTETLSQ